jgi:hypothetical protein
LGKYFSAPETAGLPLDAGAPLPSDSPQDIENNGLDILVSGKPLILRQLEAKYWKQMTCCSLLPEALAASASPFLCSRSS